MFNELKLQIFTTPDNYHESFKEPYIAWMFSTAKKKSQFFFIILLHDKAIFIRT